MVLSNVDIQKALDSKRLVILPEPSPRRLLEGGEKCPYNTSAVDLKLGSEIVEIKPRPPHNIIDLSSGGFGNIAELQTTSHKMSPTTPFILKPGMFVLGKTLEFVELPLLKKGSLAARIEGKSSFARCGLLVHFTAPTIHCGFRGTITLEMANFGPFDIVLKPDMYICQLIIEEVLGNPFRNDSAFQGQTRPGGQNSSAQNKK